MYNFQDEIQPDAFCSMKIFEFPLQFHLRVLILSVI